ncbi:MAG: hypothetical protein GYB67_00235 [Chloroflexi bacterium]|nr:hypothetical protein [Chloroflexota bacterium]
MPPDNQDKNDDLPEWLRNANNLPADEADEADAGAPDAAPSADDDDDDIEVPGWLNDEASAAPDDQPAVDLPPWLVGIEADEENAQQLAAQAFDGGDQPSEAWLAAGDNLADSAESDITYDAWMAQQLEAQREKLPEEEVPDLLSDVSQLGDADDTVIADDNSQLPDWFLGLEALDDSDAPDWLQEAAPSEPAAEAPPPVENAQVNWLQGPLGDWDASADDPPAYEADIPSLEDILDDEDTGVPRTDFFQDLVAPHTPETDFFTGVQQEEDDLPDLDWLQDVPSPQTNPIPPELPPTPPPSDPVTDALAAMADDDEFGDDSSADMSWFYEEEPLDISDEPPSFRTRELGGEEAESPTAAVDPDEEPSLDDFFGGIAAQNDETAAANFNTQRLADDTYARDDLPPMDTLDAADLDVADSMHDLRSALNIDGGTRDLSDDLAAFDADAGDAPDDSPDASDWLNELEGIVSGTRILTDEPGTADDADSSGGGDDFGDMFGAADEPDAIYGAPMDLTGSGETAADLDWAASTTDDADDQAADSFADFAWPDEDQVAAEAAAPAEFDLDLGLGDDDFDWDAQPAEPSLPRAGQPSLLTGILSQPPQGEDDDPTADADDAPADLFGDLPDAPFAGGPAADAPSFAAQPGDAADQAVPDLFADSDPADDLAENPLGDLDFEIRTEPESPADPMDWQAVVQAGGAEAADLDAADADNAFEAAALGEGADETLDAMLETEDWLTSAAPRAASGDAEDDDLADLFGAADSAAEGIELPDLGDIDDQADELDWQIAPPPDDDALPDDAFLLPTTGELRAAIGDDQPTQADDPLNQFEQATQADEPTFDDRFAEQPAADLPDDEPTFDSLYLIHNSEATRQEASSFGGLLV